MKFGVGAAILVWAWAATTGLAQTAIEDFEQYTEDAFLRGVWSDSIAWTSAFLQVNDGAEGTSQSLLLRDAGYSMGLTAPDLFSPDEEGYYKLAFSYKNGQEGEPWPDLSVVVSQGGAIRCSTLKLNDSPTTVWTPDETSAAAFTTDPVTIQILSRGVTRYAGNFACAFDEFQFEKLPCIPNTIDVFPPESLVLSGPVLFTVDTAGNCGSTIQVDFDIGDDGILDFTDIEPPFEYLWSTSLREPSRGSVPVTVHCRNSVTGPATWTGTYEVDNRCLGRRELACNGDFSRWEGNVPEGWVDFRRNLNVEIGPGSGRDEATDPSFRATFPADDYDNRYSLRHPGVRNAGGRWENHQVAYWGLGNSNRIYYYVSNDGATWRHINLLCAAVNGPDWAYAVGAVEPSLGSGLNEWSSIAVHQIYAGDHLWDDVSWQATYLREDLETQARIDDFENYTRDSDLDFLWAQRRKNTHLWLDESEATTESMRFLRIAFSGQDDNGGPTRTVDEAGGIVGENLTRPRDGGLHRIRFNFRSSDPVPPGVEVAVDLVQNNRVVGSSGALDLESTAAWRTEATAEGLLTTDPVSVVIRMSAPANSPEYQCDFDNLILERTGPALEPTPTPEPTPEPTPASPATLVVDHPENLDGSFQFADPFTPPVCEFGLGAVHLRATNNQSTFGYWEGPRCELLEPWDSPRSGAMGVTYLPGETTRLRLRWRAASTVEDPSLCPQVRFRTTTEDLHRTDALVVESSGDGAISPPTAGRDYTLLLAPDSPEGPFLPAFDLLNFGGQDAPDGEAILESLEIQALLASDPGPWTVERVYEFADDAEGWEFETSAPFDPPQSEWTTGDGGALRLSPNGSAEAFGYWTTTTPAVSVEDGRVYQARFLVRSSLPADRQAESPSFRVRINDTAFQACALVRITPRPEFPGLLPAENQPVEYEVDFVPPPELAGRGLLLSFDLMSFESSSDLNAWVSLERVEVLSAPMTDSLR